MSDGPEYGGTEDIKGLIKRHYSDRYITAEHDSPPETRQDLIDIIIHLLEEPGSIDPPVVLEIGAARQLLLHKLAKPENDRIFKEFERIHFVAADIADVHARALLAKGLPNISHIRADASKPIIAPQSAGFVFGNMCIDLMPKETLSEVAMALSPRGTFAFTLHHPDTMRLRFQEAKDLSAQTIVGFALERGYFYNSPAEIKSEFDKRGLHVTSVALHRNYKEGTEVERNKWWVVTGHRK